LAFVANARGKSLAEQREFHVQMEYTINRAEPSQIADLVGLCAQHAEFERAPYTSAGKAEALKIGLFSERPRLYAWVAVANARLIGYTTASPEYSTWSASEYLHMDCLFVVAGHRNEGIGKALFNSVVAFALEFRYAQVQWQTPYWNHDARRFYQRQGAAEQEKRRFLLNTRNTGVPAHG
jgi:GNAT superfamily N-acetyltransferase